MTVLIKSSGKGGNSVLSYSDFIDTRGDQPSFAGDGWMMCPLDGNPNPGSALTIAGVYNVASGVFSMGVSGSNGQSIIMLIPWMMDLRTLSSMSQYAQYKMLTNNSVPGLLDRRGPMVFARSNGGSCYCAEISSETSQAQIFRINKSNVSTTALGSLFSYTVNKTLRIEANNSDPLNTVVTAYVDGVVVQTVNDNSAQRIVSGLPGIYDAFCSAGITQTLNQFACGAL